MVFRTGIKNVVKTNIHFSVKVIAHSPTFLSEIKKKLFDLTLCKSCWHTASNIVIHHKQMWMGFDIFECFSNVFRICSKHFERCLTVQSHRTSEQWRLVLKEKKGGSKQT